MQPTATVQTVSTVQELIDLYFTLFRQRTPDWALDPVFVEGHRLVFSIWRSHDLHEQAYLSPELEARVTTIIADHNRPGWIYYDEAGLSLFIIIDRLLEWDRLGCRPSFLGEDDLIDMLPHHNP